MPSGWRWLLLPLLACVCLGAAAQDMKFSEVTITLGEDNRIFLDAQIDYELNEVTAEALENGVPLTFETHIQMREVGAWVWSPDVAEIRLRSVLRYRPLSSLYEVRGLDQQDKQVFATRASALRFMGRIRDLALIDRANLNPKKEYLVRLRSYLDIEALPLPLRPFAYVSSDWSMEAEPWEWRLRP